MFPKSYKKGFISGSFDLYHAGHSKIIKYAKQNCKELFIGINSDERIKEKKGINRPIYTLQHRLEILCWNSNVSAVKPIEYDGSGNSLVGLRKLLDFWEPDVWISGVEETSRKNYSILVDEYPNMEYLVLNCEVIHTTDIINKIKRLPIV